MSLLIFPSLQAAEDANALITFLANFSGQTIQWSPALVRTIDSKAFIYKPEDKFLVYTRENGSTGPISEVVGPYIIEEN